ncbi:MAG: VPLPA-CTERM sorting domain-containing protein [Pseudomonadota bacterium]
MKHLTSLCAGLVAAVSATTLTVEAARADAISYLASSAVSDPTLSASNNDHAIWLPFFRSVSGTPLTGNSNSADFDFVWDGRFEVMDNGYATLSGKIANQVDMDYAFDVTFNFRQRDGAGPDGVKRELRGSAYTENGGPIDTGSFSFFDLEGGSFTGTGALAGVNFGVENRAGSMTFPLQFGEGANGKNGNLGASVWFSLFTDNGCTNALCHELNAQNLIGDVNIDLQPVPLPAAFLLFGTGLAGLSAMRRKKGATVRA